MRAPRSAHRWAWLLASAALLTVIDAARAELVLEAEGRLGDTPSLELTATNTGTTPLDAVTPEVVFVRHTATGAPVSLAPGEHRSWTLPLATPDRPGAFPAIVRARGRSGAEGRDAALVVVVATPDAPPGLIDARLLPSPVTDSGRAELLLQNRTDRHVAGRAVLLGPAGLTPQPESQPASVPGTGLTRVLFVLQSTGPPASEPRVLFGTFEYELDGVHHTALARAEASVIPGGSRRRPLVVGLTALAVCLAVLGVALRRAARRSRG